MKRALALLCIGLLLLTLAPVAAGGAYCDARLKGDADGDGRITVADARAMLRICAGLEPAPPSGTPVYQAMKLSDPAVPEITMEDVRLVKRLALQMDPQSTYYTKEELVSLFNTLADQVKSTGHVNASRVTSFTARTQKIAAPSGSSGAIADMFASVILDSGKANETVYSELSALQPINYFFGYPVRGELFVSALRPEDVTNAVLETGKTVDFLSGYPSELGGGSLSPYQNAQVKDAIRLTVTVRSESCTALKEAGVSQTALQRLYDKNIFDDFAAYNVSSEEKQRDVTIKADLTCREITTGAVAEYWFEPGTLAPIAARYTVREAADLRADFTILYGGVTERDASDLRLDDVTEEIYLFEPMIRAAGLAD